MTRICIECAAAYPAERCPAHPDEPLLDPTEGPVREMLVDLDDRRRRKITTGLAAAFAALGFLIGAGLSAVLPALPVPPIAIMAALAIVGGLIGSVVGHRAYRRRFAHWTQEGDDPPEARAPINLGTLVGGALGAGLGFAAGTWLSEPTRWLTPPLLGAVFAFAGIALGVVTARGLGATARMLKLMLREAPQPGADESARLCLECARLYSAQSCPQHPDEPLLDPRDDLVKHELVAEDDRLRRRLFSWLSAILGGVACTLLAGSGALLGARPGLIFYLGLGGLIAGVGLGNLLARSLFRRRFAAWTAGLDEHDEVKLGQETRSGARAIRDFVRRLLWGDSGPSWGQMLVCNAAGLAFGVAAGALASSGGWFALIGARPMMFLGGLAGLAIGQELSTGLHAARKRRRIFYILLAIGVIVGTGAGLAVAFLTPWGQAGVAGLAALGAMAGCLLALELDRILRTVRHEWRELMN